MDKTSIKEIIVTALQHLDIEKVILFGSYARNEIKEGSDVDLYIVSNEEYVPETYAENMRHYKKYSQSLKILKQQIPMDVLVHTRPMNRMFEESNSAFAREIMQSGERLL